MFYGFVIRMADNPVEHSHTKHIDIRYHFLRDYQQKWDIEIAYVSTHKQLADIFTKPLEERIFCELRSELNILDSHNMDWIIAHIAYFLYTFNHALSIGTFSCFWLLMPKEEIIDQSKWTDPPLKFFKRFWVLWIYQLVYENPLES